MDDYYDGKIAENRKNELENRYKEQIEALVRDEKLEEACVAFADGFGIPASEVASSPQSVLVTFTNSRWDPLTRPASAPPQTEGRMLA